MNITKWKRITTTAGASASALAAALLLTLITGCAPWDRKLMLKPGPIADKTVYVDSARGYAFCEFEVIVGKPPHLTVEIYNTSGQGECSPSKFDPIDAKELARKVGSTALVKNPTRYWLMDRLWSYGAGETYDFDGINATWMAHIALNADAVKGHGKGPFPAYKVSQITRHSKYEWLKGSQVYLLRSADGHTWIMQAYTDLVDRNLTIADLPGLGSKLHLPPGWKYEVKTLEKDLTLVPPPPDFQAHAVADEFQNVYAGCDFGATCNYIP